MIITRAYKAITFATFLFLSSCQTTDVKVEQSSCSYGNSNTCPEGEYCAVNWKNKTSCFSDYRGNIPTIAFPYPEGVDVYCSQGTKSRIGKTHTFNTTLYAVDFNAIGQTSNVYAGASGRVIAEKNCKGQGVGCGSKFGNHVIILTDDNFAIMYAHFDKVYVSTGQRVREGDLIGLEGNTGYSHSRHLHWSVNYGWKSKGFGYYARNSGYLPSSVPFRTRICRSGGGRGCDTVTVNVQNIPCPGKVSGGG